LLVVVRAPGASAVAALDVVPSGERPPGLELVSVAAEAGLRFAVTFGSSTGTREPEAVVRLVGRDGAVLAEAAPRALSAGERVTVELAGAAFVRPGGIEPESAGDRLAVAVELCRRPKGF